MLSTVFLLSKAMHNVLYDDRLRRPPLQRFIVFIYSEKSNKRFGFRNRPCNIKVGGIFLGKQTSSQFHARHHFLSVFGLRFRGRFPLLNIPFFNTFLFSNNIRSLQRLHAAYPHHAVV